MAIYASILTGGINNHETTSEEVNGVYTDFVNEGVVGTVGNSSGVAPATGAFAVNAQGTPAMAVDVSAGVAYVEGVPTSQNAQTFRIKNTATEAVSISANASGSTKYDWVYINLSAANLNAPNFVGDNVATLTTSRSTSASADDGTPPTYGYAIAVVTVANGASTITNGNIRDIRSQVTLDTGVTVGTDGWNTLDSILSVSTGYNKGNREYEITSSEDLTSTLSPGMRLKLSRGTTPPTQCADLELSSTQYATLSSPAGITFTDDYTCEAWVKLESYGSSPMTIIARRNASTDGFQFRLDAGKVSLISLRIAGNNREYTSYQAIPLNRWVHVAATANLSANTATIYIDGVSVPFSTATTGTITAIVQQAATALTIGAYGSGSELLDGKISDPRIWSAVRTATQIQDNMNQQLVGNETNLVAYFKLDGNFNDSTSNANNLTGSGGAVATNVDNPMKSTEYGIITKVASGAITVFTGTNHNIPNMTLSTPQYSQHKVPVGFPAEKDKWVICMVSYAGDALTTGVYNYPGGFTLAVPTGSWAITAQANIDATRTASTAIRTSIFLSESNSTVTAGYEDSHWNNLGGGASGSVRVGGLKTSIEKSYTTQTPVYMLIGGTFTTTTTVLQTVDGAFMTGRHYIKAECAYL